MSWYVIFAKDQSGYMALLLHEVKGPLSYIIRMKGGAVWRRHVKKLQNGDADTQTDDVPLISKNEPIIQRLQKHQL